MNCGIRQVLEIYTPREWELASIIPCPVFEKADDVVRSPMPGLVQEVKVNAGDRVYRGQDLIVLESMKMESCIPSPCDGVIAEIGVMPGQTVETGEVLIWFRE